MRRSFLTSLCLLAVSVTSVVAQPDADRERSSRHYVLTGGRIQTVANGIVEGSLVIRDGRIEKIDPLNGTEDGAEVIDCTGMTIYPGMIDAGTQLGLVEIGSLPETRDENENGDLTPHAQALTAVNPNSVAIPVTRVSGVTTVLTSPSGGMLPGTGALINLYGYTPEQTSVAGTRLLILNFPSRARNGWWDRRTDEEIDKGFRDRMAKLDEVWDRAELYSRIDSAWNAGASEDRMPEYVPQIQALLPAIRREMKVLVEVNKAADIDSAIAWITQRNLDAALSGVSEGWRVADRIAESGLPCIVGPVLSIPRRASDRYDKAYANAGLLSKAGVKVALRTSQAANVRNLPFNAGFAAAYGMGQQEALRAVTLNPAQIFGVDSLLGSIEPGKQATFFVADGDPFEPATKVTRLFINGWDVPLESRHTDLYDEFLERKP